MTTGGAQEPGRPSVSDGWIELRVTGLLRITEDELDEAGGSEGQAAQNALGAAGLVVEEAESV